MSQSWNINPGLVAATPPDPHSPPRGRTPGGRREELLDVPGYVFQALVTSLPASELPLAVWRYYNGRADCET